MAVFRKKKPDWQSRTGEDQFHKNWFIQFRSNGKTHFFSSKTTNKTKAEQVERKLRNEIHSRSMLGAAEKIELAKGVALYQQSKEQSPAYKTYKSVGGKVFVLLQHRKFVHDIDTSDVVKMNEQMKRDGYSNQTRITYTHFIRAMIKLCIDLGYSARTDIVWPVIGVDPGRVRVLTDDEETSLLHELHPARLEGDEKFVTQRQDNYDYILCLLDTGARCGEISRLKWSQIDLKEGTINLHRTKAARGGYKNVSYIYMSDRIKDVFVRRSKKPHAEWVYPNSKGTSFRSAPSDAFGRARDKAGIKDFHIHDLRHSAASKLIRNGFSLHEVSLMLGHSDLKMSARYASFAETDVSKRARDIFNDLNRKRVKASLKSV